MKLKYLVAPLLFAAAAVTGCQETAETYPAIYMTDAQNNPDKSMTIDEPPAETSITVSSSVVMEHDVRIQLEVRPELLAAYNDKYGKNYQIPPEESYALSSTETTILAGYNTSSAIDFTVSSVSEFAEGVTYCVPVGIKTVSGGISVLEPSRTLFIVLKTPVISKAIYLGSATSTMCLRSRRIPTWQPFRSSRSKPAYTCSASSPAILTSAPSWVSRAFAACVSAT